ncbi:hypothetical protein R1flu_001990 [Riccia fluitans]|uniref:Uncharacterized protein n=1 Tax=Riccia fluitans TaxID=41844 RepID=A0ABD1Y5C3_9MARC
MTTPKTAAAATKVEETKTAKDIATLPIAISIVGSMKATKEVAANGKGTHAANGTLIASIVEKVVKTLEEVKPAAVVTIEEAPEAVDTKHSKIRRKIQYGSKI